MKKYIIILLAVFVAQVSWAQEFVKHDGVTYLVTETVSTTNTSDILTEVVKNVVIFTDSADVTKLTGTVVFPATFEQESVSGDVTTKTTYNVNGFKYWRYGSKVSLDMSNLISMTSIQISTDNSIYSPNSWTYLDYNYYQQNIGIYSDIETLVLPKSVTEITFSQTNVYGPKHIAAFEVDGENNDFTAIDGVLFSKDEKTLICYPHLKDGVAYTVPDGVTTIGDRAFYDNDKLQSITLNEGLTNIGEYSFYSNGSLYDCYLPSTLTVIGDYAFYDNTKLSSVLNNNVFPSGLLQIGGYAFQNCKLNLSNNQLELPGSLKKIGNYCFHEAFKNNSSVTVIFPSTVGLSGSQLYVEGYAFNCNIIKSLMTDPVDLESNAFYYVGTRYVPKGYKDIYEAKNGWKDYGTIKETTSLDNNPEWETVEAVKVDTILDVNNTLVSVKLSCATDGATIRYVNSSAQSELTKDPVDWYEYDTTESPELSVENGATVRTIAMKDGMNSSSISEFTLDISAMSCKQPIINAATNSTTMTMAVSDGSDIYYTTDGSTPTTTNGTKYEGAITLDGNFTYKAIAAQSGKFSSEPCEKEVNWFKCKTPTVKYEAATPDGNDVVVTLSTDEEGATLKYNLGSGDYVDYTSPVTVSTGSYFYYVSTKANYNDSDYPNIYLNRNKIKCEKPSIGVDQETKLLTLTASEEDYDIYYSMDGSSPSVNEMYKYAGIPVAITGNYSITAIAHKPGMFQSDQASTPISNWFTCPNVNIEQLVVDGSPKMKLSLADSTYAEGMQVYWAINNWWSYEDGWKNSATAYDGKPVYVSNGNTIYAVAIKEGFNKSPETKSLKMDYSSYTKCATPSIELDNENKTITMTTTETNGKIYYTVDGTTPTTASSLYSEPFTSEVNCIVQAITARDPETVDEVTTVYANSDVNSINLDDWFRLQNVKFIPVVGAAEGEYKMALEAEEGVTVEYGINTYGGTNYDLVKKDTFVVSEGDWVYAIARKEGFVDSGWSEFRVASNNYTVNQPNVNDINTNTGEIFVTTSTEGADIYYTTNGDDPTAESMKIEDGKVIATRNDSYKFIAIKSGMTNSAIRSYSVDWFQVPQVNINVYGEDNQLKAELTCDDKDATIYYGIGNGNFNSENLTANAKYDGKPLSIRNESYIYAAAMKDGFNNSNTTQMGYIYESSYRAGTPSITVAADTMVTITGEEGATFYYTIDGTDPTLESKKFTEKFKLTENTTIKAMAVVDKKLYSQTRTNNYNGFYCAAVDAEQILDHGLPKMKLTCSTPDAIIYYGIGWYGDTEYTSPIEANDGSTIYYRATKKNFGDSNWGSTSMSYSGFVQCSSPSITLNSETKTVTMETSETNGVIYYTLDGTTPTTASTKYTKAISPKENCTIKAVTTRKAETVDDVVTTYVNSNVSQTNLDDWFRPQTVKFRPVLGTTEGTYRMVLEAEKGTTIEYGINEYGHTVYTDTFDVNYGDYVYAIAKVEGGLDSYWREYRVSTDNYTVKQPSVSANDVSHIMTVTTETEGADIYYTTDGTTPTTSSKKLTSSEMTITRNDTYKFMAAKSGMYNSNVYEHTINWFTVSEVKIEPFVENNVLKVRLSCDDKNATIHYGINDFNSDNVTANAEYKTPFEIQNGNRVYASAVRAGYNNSSRAYSGNIYTSTYTCKTPTITIAVDTTMTITPGAEGETIYYTLDGTDPTTSSSKFTSKIKLTGNVTIKAIAAATGKLNSSINERTYNNFYVQQISFSLEDTKMTITSSTQGVSIKYQYEAEGTSTMTYPHVYSGPFDLKYNGTIYVLAEKEGYNSATSSNYINNVVKCKVEKQSYDGHSLKLKSSEGATIWYTIDGNRPYDNTNNWYSYVYKYDGEIAIDKVGTIKAIATAPYMNESDVFEEEIVSFAGETGATSEKAGGLEASMGWKKDPENIKEFTVTGPVNSADMSYIREKMTSLERLDLSAASTEDGIIPDNAFAGLPLLTFSSPKDVKTVGSKIFSGCKNLAAVEWNSETKIKDDAFDSDANPNLLLYVVGRNDAPNNVRNIIVNNTASNIYLNDGENNNFYCPKQFYAENITYIHEFTLESGNDSGWETMALPFDCDKFVHETKGELLPFASYNEQQNQTDYKPFWLRELTDIGFQDVKQMEANKPYLICMPNNSTYATRYRLGGNVTFSASNKWVPATNPQSLTKGMKSMTANFLNNSDTDEYYLLNTEATDDYKAGSAFLKSGRALRPFEAYVTSQNAASRAISLSRGFGDDPDGDEGTTAMKVVEPDANGLVKVYNLSGVLVKQGAKEDVLRGLAKGVYIMNGKRVIVK